MVEKERKPCPFTLTMGSSYLEYKYKTYKHQVELRGIPSYGGVGGTRGTKDPLGGLLEHASTF